jgi:hypothetical protein
MSGIHCAKAPLFLTVAAAATWTGGVVVLEAAAGASALAAMGKGEG